MFFLFNKVVLVGRLTKDPELRYTNSGIPVASYTLAVNRTFKSASGEKETDFINIVCWRKLAEISAKYLKKGRLALIEGRIQTRKYQAQDGSQRTAFEVLADNMQMLETKAMMHDDGGTSSFQGKDTSYSSDSDFSKRNMEDFNGMAPDDNIDFEDVPF